MIRRILGALLLALVAGYVAMRPSFVESMPHLTIAEYPVGLIMVVVGLTLVARPRAARAVEPAWARHRQIERALPDPDAARVRSAFDAWLSTGSRTEEAAHWAAKAFATPPDEVRARMRAAKTPRARERLLLALLGRPTTGA